MAVSVPAVAEALTGIVGREHVLTDPTALDAHAVDGMIPRWVVSPASATEASRVMAVASAERMAVTPRGSGSSLGLGRAPARLDMVLDCRRMSSILEHAPDDMVATVETGVALGRLGARLELHRQRLPIDPPGAAERTLGGVLATNATGPLRFRYGAPRDLLLGVRFVQADGTITWGGARVVKSVSGYDVPKLLVGSLGTLGVIVEATLRLHPIPPAADSWLAGFRTLEAGAAFLEAVVLSSLEPERVTVLNERASEALRIAPARLAVALSVASVEEAVADQGRAVERLARDHGGSVVIAPTSLWADLDRAARGEVVAKLGCKPHRLLHWLGEAERRAGAAGLRISAVGEARSGMLRLALFGPITGRSLADLVGALRQGLGEEDGSLVLERLPAAFKAECEPWGPVEPAVLEIMRRLKREFDPQGVLNPGRFVGGL